MHKHSTKTSCNTVIYDYVIVSPVICFFFYCAALIYCTSLVKDALRHAIISKPYCIQ